MRLALWILALGVVLCLATHIADHWLGVAECEPPSCVAQDERPGTIYVPVHVGPSPAISR